MFRSWLSAWAVAAALGARAVLAQDVELVSRAHPTLVSDAAWGVPAAMSADGRYVAFVSPGNALAGQTGPGFVNLYVLDRVTDAVTLVSHAWGAPNQGGDTATYGLASMSADGRFLAFLSKATDLVAGSDTNGKSDAFLFDRQSGAITLVSRTVASATTTGNGIVSHVAISADGAWLAFVSDGTDYVTGVDNNGWDGFGDDVFLFERATGTVRLVSHLPGQPGDTGNGPSSGPSLSADGSRLAFASFASNLVPAGDSNGKTDVFVYGRDTGEVRLVSRSASAPATSANGESSSPTLSADGGWLAFVTYATDIVPGSDTNGTWDLILMDVGSGAATLVSHAASGPTTTANWGSYDQSIDATGRWVVYRSDASDLVAPADGNGQTDVYLYDRLAGTNRLVSHAASGPAIPGNGRALGATLSLGGAAVFFYSEASDLVTGSDLNAGADLFAFSTSTGQVRLVSHSVTGPTQASSTSQLAGPWTFSSADGSSVAHGSPSADLTAVQDTDGGLDAFVWDAATGANTLLSRRRGNPSATAGGWSARSAVSADGRYVAFLSAASNLVAGQVDGNGVGDVFLRDRQAGTTTLVSHAPGQPARAGDGEATEVSLSDDGRWVAFASAATDLVDGDGNNASDVFLFDRLTGAVRLVSYEAGASWKAAGGASRGARLSADGRRLVFTSGAPNLVAGDANGADDVFLHDVATGANVLVSHAAVGPGVAANGYSRSGIPSADGGFVAFTSEASNLVVGSETYPHSYDAFRYEVSTGQNVLLSHRFGQPAVAAGDGDVIGISADGSVAAFLSGAYDLVSGTPIGNGTPQAYLYHVPLGQALLASHAYTGPTDPGTLAVQRAVLSRDGRWLAFFTGSDLLPPPLVGYRDAYLFDRLDGSVRLVGHVPGDPLAGGNSGTYYDLAIDGTGSLVAFRSYATNLVAGSTGYRGTNVFGYLRATGEVRLLSHVPGDGLRAGNDDSALEGVSADGSTLTISAAASDLVADDYNVEVDLFVAAPGPVPVELSSFIIE